MYCLLKVLDQRTLVLAAFSPDSSSLDRISILFDDVVTALQEPGKVALIKVSELCVASL